MLQSLYIKNDKRRYVQGGKHMNTTKECSRNMAIAKFIIFSCLGIFLFFVSININGVNVIPIQHIINFINAKLGAFLPYYTLVMVSYGGIMPIIKKSYKKSKFDLFFTIAKAFGIVIAVMAIFNIGPSALMQSDMIPFLFNKLVMPIAVMIPVVGVAYVLLLKFGLVEFIGEFMQPVMRKLFKTPGESAVDALVSYTGGYALAVLLTNDFYKKGVYTRRESIIISTGFSTVSTSFLLIIANTLDLMDHWNLYFFSCLVATAVATAVCARIYPICKEPADYYDKPAEVKATKEGNLFARAFESGVDTAQHTESLATHLKKYYVGDAMKMASAVTASILTIGLIGLIIANFTPVFTWIGYIFYPFTKLLCIPEPMLAAKAAAIEIAEMFLPTLLVTSAPIITKFTIAVTSVSAVLFFSASIPSLLSTDIPIKMRTILLIWVERTIISLIVAAGIAHLFF